MVCCVKVGYETICAGGGGGSEALGSGLELVLESEFGGGLGFMITWPS